MGRLLNLYSPLALATVVVFALVAWLTASTVAPATTAPDLSTTVPTRSPLIACPNATAENISNVTHSRMSRGVFMINFSYLFRNAAGGINPYRPEGQFS